MVPGLRGSHPHHELPPGRSALALLRAVLLPARLSGGQRIRRARTGLTHPRPVRAPIRKTEWTSKWATVRVLIACEFSGIVRDAFRAAGHEALSCDLEPTDRPGPHYQGDVRDLIGQPWDLVIGFPPCTYLAASGNRWHAGTPERAQAAEFARLVLNWPAPAVAVENPIGYLSTAIRPPDQIVHPWQFGHGEVKATCLWLSGLNPLQPTKRVSGRQARVHREGQHGAEPRWKRRSRTYQGIAAAMAAQWTGDLPMTLF
jgi:hypothetical protein